MASSNIDQLPTEILMKIGLELPLQDVASICESSSSLYRLCKSQVFWAERLKVDYPMYVPEHLSISLTYHKYYELLYRTLYLTDDQGKLRFNRDIYALVSDRLVSLVYPLPKLLLDDQNYLRADVKIIRSVRRTGLRVNLIGYHHRKTMGGSIIPIIQLPKEIKQMSLDEVAEGNEKYRLEEIIQSERFDSYYFIQASDHLPFMNAAQSAGYVSYDPNQSFSDDPELFNRLKIGNEKKPSPVTNPSAKVKKIFGFL